MERFNALSRGMQIMLVASVLLLIDSFFDWQHVEATFLGRTIEGGASGWHGVGFIMGLLTVILIAWIVVRLAASDFKLPVSDAMTGALLGFLILLFTVIKFFADNEARHWPAWVGLILAVVIAVGAWMAVQEAGGVDHLRTEASSVSSSMNRPDTTTSAAPPPAAPPPAAPPAAAPPSEPTSAPPPSEPMASPPSSEPMGTPPPADEPGTGEDRPL